MFLPVLPPGNYDLLPDPAKACEAKSVLLEYVCPANPGDVYVHQPSSGLINIVHDQPYRYTITDTTNNVVLVSGVLPPSGDTEVLTSTSIFVDYLVTLNGCPETFAFSGSCGLTVDAFFLMNPAGVTQLHITTTSVPDVNVQLVVAGVAQALIINSVTPYVLDNPTGDYTVVIENGSCVDIALTTPECPAGMDVTLDGTDIVLNWTGALVDEMTYTILDPSLTPVLVSTVPLGTLSNAGLHVYDTSPTSGQFTITINESCRFFVTAP